MSHEQDTLLQRGIGNAVDIEERRTSSRHSRVGFILAVGLTVLVIIAVISVVIVGWILKMKEADPAYLLSNAILTENIMQHIDELQKVADDNGNSRSVMTGYQSSAQYIMDKLKGVGCTTVTQNFKTPVFTEHTAPQLSVLSPFQIEFQNGVDFAGLRYGGNGLDKNITSTVCPISNVGCDDSDFNGTTVGCIALIQYSPDCPLITQALNAEKFNASAAIIYNNAERTSLITSRVRGPGWAEGDKLVNITVIAASYSLGTLLKDLHASQTLTLSLFSNTSIEIAETFNIFCTTDGTTENVVMAGAHLDSVPEGAGINDNGSGSSTLLEIVLSWYSLGLKSENKIRFAWWGSEELGLIGSRYYVKDLQTNNHQELANIAMYLNFDMLGSPNYYLGVHSGSTAVAAQNESMVITSMFIEYFQYMEQSCKLIDLLAGSDFVPFVEASIPSGGLASGAGGIKTESERDYFSGFCNAPYDPCYHRYCDTSYNINQDALAILSSSAAYVIQKAAQHKDLRTFLATEPPHELTICDAE